MTRDAGLLFEIVIFTLGYMSQKKKTASAHQRTPSGQWPRYASVTSRKIAFAPCSDSSLDGGAGEGGGRGLPGRDVGGAVPLVGGEVL